MSAPLFRRLLGPALDALPPSLAAVHDGAGPIMLVGTARVWRSAHPLAHLLCELMRLPRAGDAVPVSVRFERDGTRERWVRTFGGRRYASRLSARDGLLVERMGPATNRFCLSVEQGTLVLDLVGFRFAGVPMPRVWRPVCRAVERDMGGDFGFDIPIALPGLGPIIRYSGRLRPHQEPRA